MKEENLIYYLIIWALFVGFILIIAGVKDLLIRKKEKMLLLYIERLLYTWGSGVSHEGIIAEIYFNLKPGTSLSKIMKRAQKIVQGPKDSLSQLAEAFSYIEKKLQAFPVCIYHQVILSLDRKPDKELLGLTHEIKNLWIKELKEHRLRARAAAIKGTAMILVLMALNLGIYLKWQETISFKIFMVINVLGLFVFAIIVLGKGKKTKMPDAGKVAFLQWQLELINLSAENSVIDAIYLSYDRAPKLLKPGLKELIENIKVGSKSVKPYNDMCQGSCFAEMYECMGVLYERRQARGPQAIDYQVAAVRNYIRSLHRDTLKAAEQKIKAATGAALRLYQCAGSVGLMVNIVTILLHSVGQAA